MVLILVKVPKGNPYHSATSGEMAIYRAHSLILKKVVTLLDDANLLNFFFVTFLCFMLVPS